MSNELKALPCAFCGGAVDRLDKGSIGFASGDGLKYVVCPCGAMGGGGKTGTEAIANWNRRATSGAASVEVRGYEVRSSTIPWHAVHPDNIDTYRERGWEIRALVAVNEAAPAEQSAPPVPQVGGITNEEICKLICDHTGQRISLRRDEIDQHIDFARALLATQSASTAPGQAETERDAFEAWIGLNDRNGPQADRFEGAYTDNYVGEMWEAWKARAAIAMHQASAAKPQKATLGDVWTSGGVHWDLFPGFLIDTCDGNTLSEEGLQFALAEMLKDPDYLRVVSERAAAEPVPTAAAPVVETDACFVCNGSGYRESHAGDSKYLCGQCQGAGRMPKIAATKPAASEAVGVPMRNDTFTVIPQNMVEYRMSVREPDNESDLFREAFAEACLEDRPDGAKEAMFAWDFFKYGWLAAIRILATPAAPTD